ncbi:MAG: hypothetical protein MGF17_13615 [Trichodesmium sp. MAG_R04]|nr:hypothetical protein [Trichodesmium sp. MAG_R04]
MGNESDSKTTRYFGVDVGINALTTCSDGSRFSSTKSKKNDERRYQLRVNKKEPGGRY